MPKSKLQEYLDSQKVKYTLIKYSPVYTAQEIAASAHIPGSQMAKTVMIKVDGKMVMAVLPAPNRVNFERMKELCAAKKIELASEQEFKSLFPECEVGAMPPFGNLYGLDVYAEEELAEEIEIAFCAGSHGELIRMPFKDFQRLANPKIHRFSYKA